LTNIKAVECPRCDKRGLGWGVCAPCWWCEFEWAQECPCWLSGGTGIAGWKCACFSHAIRSRPLLKA
jgi:hypothetical protein